MLVPYLYLQCMYMYCRCMVINFTSGIYSLASYMYMYVACIPCVHIHTLPFFVVSTTLHYCDNCVHVATGSSPERTASSGSNWRPLSVGLCTHRPPTAVSSHTSSTHQNPSSSPFRRPSMTMWWVFTSETASGIELIDCYIQEYQSSGAQ